jgi:hypothetical protein
MLFDAGVMVTEQMERLIVLAAQEVAKRAINACASHYNFDGEEALRLLNLNDVRVIRKVGERKEKKGKVVVSKPKFALPYSGECNDSLCHGLRQNSGLYTQCQSVRKGENVFCRSCQSSADKNDGMPEYGTIVQRREVGILEYVDPKGRKPVAYIKMMKKLKVSKEQVLEEAGKHGITIDVIHFVESVEEGKRGRPKAAKAAKEPKGVKGRPKKSKKVLEIEGDEEDLFASLVASANSESDSESESEAESETVVVAVEEVKKVKVAKVSEEKAEKRLKEKAEKDAKIAAEKAEKEAQRLKEKAEKEAKIAAEKAEKEAKIAAEKAEKEAKIAAEKAEKEAKIAAEKAAKALKKQQEEEAKALRIKEKESTASKSKKSVSPVEEEEEAQPDIVKKIEIDGKKYLKSKNTGIIYDYTEYVKNGEQVVVGKWNESKNKIDFTVADEESEEEYEEED